MESGHIWLLYLAVNFLITLICCTIPGCINFYRQKYNLPPRIFIWPLRKETFPKDEDDAIIKILWITLLGIIGAVPVAIGYIVLYKFLYKNFIWIIKNITFSKEEKVQIAVESIQKKGK